MKPSHFFAVLILVFLVDSCKKSSDPANYIIANTINKHITVNIYATLVDYYAANNPFKTVSINGNSIGSIPLADFDTSHAYYIDWYTDDYWFSNWTIGSSNDTVFFRIKPKAGNDKYQVVVADSGWQRRLCLNGNSGATTWKAYNAYSYSYISIWSTLSANDQYRQLILRKNLTASYIHKDASGTFITDSITYSFINPNTPDMVMAEVSGSSMIGHFDNRSSVAVTATPLSKDTIAVGFSDGYFMMARQ